MINPYSSWGTCKIFFPVYRRWWLWITIIDVSDFLITLYYSLLWITFWTHHSPKFLLMHVMTQATYRNQTRNNLASVALIDSNPIERERKYWCKLHHLIPQSLGLGCIRFSTRSLRLSFVTIEAMIRFIFVYDWGPFLKTLFFYNRGVTWNIELDTNL